MLNLENQILDISEIKSLALKISKNLRIGDVVLLKGDLGVGKTTFSRFIINNIHDLKKFPKPSLINSPTYPILITYNLEIFEIYHYDFYRIKNVRELDDLDFFENIQKSITLIEWPELLIDLPFKNQHYIINLSLHSETKRIINIKHYK